jgi:hypothetical protein
MGIKTTQKQLREMVHDLAIQGLCNEQAMGYGEWAKVHNRQDYTCIAYSQGRYGTIASLYYLKQDKTFAYV